MNTQIDYNVSDGHHNTLTRALIRLERTMNVLEGGKGGEGRVAERGWVGERGRVGERGSVGREVGEGRVG